MFPSVIEHCGLPRELPLPKRREIVWLLGSSLVTHPATGCGSRTFLDIFVRILLPILSARGIEPRMTRSHAILALSYPYKENLTQQQQLSMSPFIKYVSGNIPIYNVYNISMQTQGQLPDSNRPIWIVLDDNYLPIEPIQKYLRYLDSLEESLTRLGVYANNLKLFWEFLRDKHLDWKEMP